MKRFLKILVLLVVSLFVVVSGVDVALDHLSRSVVQNTYTYFNEHGDIVVAFTGDPGNCPVDARPAPILSRSLHRT